MNREPMNGAEQHRSMENGEQDKKNCERNPNATPFSCSGGIFLLIIFHEHFTLWTGRERARAAPLPRRRTDTLPRILGRAEARPSVLPRPGADKLDRIDRIGKSVRL